MKTDENNRVWATHLKPSLICTPPSHHSCNNTRMSSLPSALQHPPRNHRHLLYSERDVGAGVRRSETELVPCVPSCKVGPQASVRICLHSMSIPHSRGCDIKEQIKNILTGWKPAERKKKNAYFSSKIPHIFLLWFSQMIYLVPFSKMSVFFQVPSINLQLRLQDFRPRNSRFL